MGLITDIVSNLLRIYSFVLLAYAISSWFSPDPYSPIVQLLSRLCEPVLNPIRRLIPPMGGLDLSVLIAIILLQFLSGLLARSYYSPY